MPVSSGGCAAHIHCVRWQPAHIYPPGRARRIWVVQLIPRLNLRDMHRSGAPELHRHSAPSTCLYAKPSLTALAGKGTGTLEAQLASSNT